MSIREILNDILKQCALDNVEVIKITSSDDKTLIQTRDDDKTLFIEGHLPKVDDFSGEFGVMNLKMLSGIINLPSYQSDESVKIGTRLIEGKKVIDQLNFSGNGTKSTFKLMDIKHVPEQSKIINIPWDVTISNIDDAIVTDLRKFAGLYSDVDKDKMFSLKVEDGNLLALFGNAASSSHSGSMVIAKDVVGVINGNLTFPVHKVLMLMKIGLSNKSFTLNLTNKGVLGVEAVTNHGTYKYYLRQSVR